MTIAALRALVARYGPDQVEAALRAQWRLDPCERGWERLLAAADAPALDWRSEGWLA